MKHRPFTLVLSIGMVMLAWLLLACTQSRDQEAFEVGSEPFPYHGETSLEERIANYPTIVRGTLDRVTSEAVAAGGDGYGKGKYVVVVKFHITVSEYLQGTGATGITAVWGSEALHDSRGDAEAAIPALVSRRDTSFDDREAVFFLTSDFWELYAGLKADNTYFTEYVGEYWYEYPFFDLNSRYNKLWLPAVVGGSGTGDAQEFLLALPDRQAPLNTPTITLGALKAKIAEVNTVLNGGDGSEAYKECVRRRYEAERFDRHSRSEGHDPSFRSIAANHSVTAGAPAGTVIYEIEVLGHYPDQKFFRTWLDDGDAGLFEMVDGPTTPREFDHDGVLTAGVDWIAYTQSLRSKRPLPPGAYKFNIKDEATGPITELCNEASSHEWTVTVTSTSGVLHEAFFDPVAIGSAVGADGANGVLKPASFTDRNGAPATIESISWEAGAVKVRVVPWSNLSLYVLNFIELDGTTSLSLNLANSSVDVARDTLTWSVASQPWEDGDKLMVRIREAPPFANPPRLLTAAASVADAVDLSWGPVSSASGYHVQRRESGEEAWASVDAGVTGTTHTVSGLSCETDYEFRVGAYGDGTRYDTRVGPRSGIATATTGTCMPQRPPVLSTSTYAFSVAENAATTTRVGAVSATDPDEDSITYTITAGDDGGVFAIGSSTGVITVAGALDYETASSHTLTVQAADGNGGAATATVKVSVTDVTEN